MINIDIILFNHPKANIKHASIFFGMPTTTTCQPCTVVFGNVHVSAYSDRYTPYIESICSLQLMSLADFLECEHSTQNDCDQVNGVCLDEPAGSFTCGCKAGYYMTPDDTCRGETASQLMLYYLI